MGVLLNGTEAYSSHTWFSKTTLPYGYHMDKNIQEMQNAKSKKVDNQRKCTIFSKYAK